jgi:hypothetical protein
MKNVNIAAELGLICDVYFSPLDLVEHHPHSIPLEVRVPLEGKNLYMQNFYMCTFLYQGGCKHCIYSIII